MIVTIDGPVASGKSTVGRLLAQRLRYFYICSGYLYRAMAYVLTTYYGYNEKTIANPTDEDLSLCCDPAKLVYFYEGSQEKIFFNGRDITAYLKDSFVDKITALISINQSVREYVMRMQHTLANEHDCVIDGRDVGSNVFPQAEVKFFLTASVQVRAQRWLLDQKKIGHFFSLEKAIAQITDRDERDKTRKIAPLVIPTDAYIVDSSTMTIEQVVECLLKHVQEKLR